MIVRELITKLSFQVDRRGIENFNRSILGIKSRIGLATSAIGGFVAGVFKATSAIANSILDTADLAKNIGETTSEVNSLVKAISTYRIPAQTAENSISRVSQSLIEARQGFGSLFELSNRSEVEIRDSFGNMLPPIKVFMNLLEEIGKIQDETYGRELARQELGDPRFFDIARNLEEFTQIREQLSLTSDTMDNTIEDAREFSKNWILLWQEFTEATRVVLTPLVKFFANLFKGINEEIIRPAQRGTFWEEFFKNIGEEARDFDRLLGFQNNSNPQNPNNTNQTFVRNNINITVPAGTEEQQVDFIRNGANEAFDESFERGFEKIGNDFPRTE